jgi:hypothetical protein
MGEGRRIADAAALADACPSPVPLPSVGLWIPANSPHPASEQVYAVLGSAPP